jgi:hypothetical protein
LQLAKQLVSALGRNALAAGLPVEPDHLLSGVEHPVAVVARSQMLLRIGAQFFGQPLVNIIRQILDQLFTLHTGSPVWARRSAK